MLFDHFEVWEEKEGGTWDDLIRSVEEGPLQGMDGPWPAHLLSPPCK